MLSLLFLIALDFVLRFHLIELSPAHGSKHRLADVRTGFVRILETHIEILAELEAIVTAISSLELHAKLALGALEASRCKEAANVIFLLAFLISVHPVFVFLHF